MRSRLARSFIVLLLPVSLACGSGRADELSADLEQDLSAVNGSALEMAPAGGQRLDVAAELLAGHGKSPSVKSVSRNAAIGDANPDRVATAPAESGTPHPQPDTTRTAGTMIVPDTVPGTTRPTMDQPRRQGPYKSVGAVIRDAPFPINP